MDTTTLIGLGIFGAIFLYTAMKFVKSVRLVQQQHSEIVERFGKYDRTLNAGFHILVPFMDKVAYMLDHREESVDVLPQEAFTNDNVRVEVDGVIYMKVVDSKRAAYGITNYRYAATQLAQTTTRAVIGTLELDTTFEERDKINNRVVSVLNEAARNWGIQVLRYEVKNIVPPPTVRDAMERQMGAERERRAVLARAEGEKQSRVNQSAGQTADMINRSEGAKQKRINEAQGKAEEILSLAHATAESIEKMGEALVQPGGADAIRLKLSQKYITSLGNLKGSTIVMPADISRIDELLESIGLSENAEHWQISDEEKSAAKKLPPVAKRPVPTQAPSADTLLAAAGIPLSVPVQSSSPEAMPAPVPAREETQRMTPVPRTVLKEPSQT